MLFHYLFFIGSIGGFFIELIYRKIKINKWVKPGVFKGYYLPLYGLGLVICYSCYILKINFFIKLFLASLLLLLIEYICGEIFINKLKIKLWDYNDEFLNYKGLICLRFYIYWLLLGLFSFFIFYLLKDININNLYLNILSIIYDIILVIDVFLFFRKTMFNNN